MDDDIFSDLCIMNAKKTYSKPFKKSTRAIPKYSKNIYELIDVCEPLSTKAAVEYLLDGKLKSAVCRYCLNISPGLSELDQVMQIAGTGSLYKVTIREMIACFYPFKATQDPNLPEKICQKCLDKAINAYLFTQQCEQAERALFNCIDDIYEKLGKLDPIDRPKKRGRQKLNPNYNVLYAEHEKVIDYAEPVRNLINAAAESLTQELDWNEFECKKCWQVLPNLEMLLNHEKIHPKYMWYHCRLCGKSFVKHIQLKKHYNQVHVLGRGSIVKADKNFKCKECGQATENYVQHLQHIEKHKFKGIMKLLIEKKTDKLCMVCLNKTTDLVELDKMICIHGGHPELMGDKTLYSILASTLPDRQTYKYQELHVTRKANIMTILKNKNKIQRISNNNSAKDITSTNQFILSLPRIISKDKCKTNDFYHFVFCDPQIQSTSINMIDNATMDTKSAEIIELTDDKYPTNMSPKKVAKLFTPRDKIVSDNEEPIISNCQSILYVVNKHKVPPDMITNGKNLNDTSNNGHKASMDFIQDVYAKDKTETNDKKPTELSKNCNVGAGNIIKEVFDNPNMFNFSNPIYIKKNDNTHEVVVTGAKSNKKLDMDMDYKFIFSNPKWINMESKHQQTDDIKIKKDIIISKNDKRLLKEKIYHNWVFSMTSPISDQINYSDNNVTAYINNNFVQPKIDCKLCWLFKNTNKCEHCQKPIDKYSTKFYKTSQDVEKDVVTNNLNSNVTDSESDIEFNKYINTENNLMQVEMGYNKVKTEKIWQCNVCLTTNDANRCTCYCCESKRNNDNESLKFMFGNNSIFCERSQQKVDTEGFNFDKSIVAAIIDTPKNENTLLDIIEEPSMMDFKSQDNFKHQVMNNIATEIPVQSMDIETDYYQYNQKSYEDMDIEENPLYPNLNQNFNTISINTLSTGMIPYVGTNIQFNMGSKNHGKGMKTTKRPLRNVRKAFHK